MCSSGGQDDTRRASELTSEVGRRNQGQGAPSAEALGAIMTLLDACLAAHHMPTLQDVVSAAKKNGARCFARSVLFTALGRTHRSSCTCTVTVRLLLPW